MAEWWIDIRGEGRWQGRPATPDERESFKTMGVSIDDGPPVRGAIAADLDRVLRVRILEGCTPVMHDSTKPCDCPPGERLIETNDGKHAALEILTGIVTLCVIPRETPSIIHIPDGASS